MCLQYIIHHFHLSLESHIGFDFLTGWFKKGFEGIRISFSRLLSYPLHAIWVVYEKIMGFDMDKYSIGI